MLVLSGITTVQAQKRGAGNAPKTKPAAAPTAAAIPEKEPPAPRPGVKKTVVVLDFDDASLSEKKIQVGRQAALFLANKFNETDKYTVIERQRLLQILDQQNISQNADRYDAKLAAKIGKVFSASVVVLGTVTEYTVKTSSKGLPGFKKVTISAKIGLVVRLVNVNTGILLDSVTVDGIAEEKNTSTFYSDKATIADEDLRIRLFTAAANDAVGKAILGIEPSISQVPESKNSTVQTGKTPPNSPLSGGGTTGKTGGKVAQVAGASIYISGLSGAVVGDKFTVMRVGREVKDPDTGEVLDVESEKIAEVQITEIRPKIAVAKITSGAGIKPKDLVKPVE